MGFRISVQFDFCPHPQGMRLENKGFSHGLKKCPPDTFLHQCAHWCRPFESQYPNKKSGTRRCGFRIFGRSIGIRTRGLLDPNQARYQTSPYPDCQNIILIICAFVKCMPENGAYAFGFFMMHKLFWGCFYWRIRYCMQKKRLIDIQYRSRSPGKSGQAMVGASVCCGCFVGPVVRHSGFSDSR